jgi:hypothetical protein
MGTIKKQIIIDDEDIANIKECLNAVGKIASAGVDVYPFTLIAIIREYEKAHVEDGVTRVRPMLCRNCSNWEQAPNPEMGTCNYDETGVTTNFDTRCLLGSVEKVNISEDELRNQTKEVKKNG